MPDLNRSLLVESENADTLGGLTDVTITAAEEFQGLSYNGTQWVNSHIPVVSYVRNAEANTLTTGTVVYLFGGTGDHATVKRADNSSDTTSSKTLGIVANPISASQNGPVVTRGYVDGMDLSVGYSVGDILWLNTNGTFTTTKPTSPAHLVFIGVVVRASVNGIIYVAVQNGYELNELHDVNISNTLAAGDFLKYNGSLWVNGPITLGTDTTGNYVATITGTANEITVTGSGSESAAVTLSLPANVTIANNLTVTGDLTVNGNTTTLNTANLNVEDNFVLLNSGVTGSPTLNAGIEVERGTSTNVAIRWNETTDKWEFTVDGTNYTELGAGGATVSSTAPSTPTTGSLWFDSDDGKTYVYYDSSWVEIGGNPLGVTISDSAPSSPIAGQVWFNSNNAGTYVYYDSHWIEIGSSGLVSAVSATAPASPVTGQIWFNSEDAGTYIYYDSAWIEIGAAPFNTLLSTIDAKGDLLVGTADNTVSRLAAGTDGYFLKANSNTATGLEWSSVPTINNLDDIGDVSTPLPVLGDVLVYGDALWYNEPATSFASRFNLSNVGEVAISEPSAGQVLQWNGVSWVNQTVSSDVMKDSKNAALLIMDIGV
jgi:hypothetical protein